MIRKVLFSTIILLICCLTSLEGQRKKKSSTPAIEKKHFLDTLSLNGLKWRSVGPAVTSGRISDFAVHSANPSTYYVATASGGVWKTTNNGTTYKPIFDGQGSYSIGCITLDPNNPNVVWVGTGENNNQRSVGYGDGVYKSEDGGQSWKHMGLKESEHIGKIIIDPEDSHTIYVAAIGPLWREGGDRGLYKSSDNGNTWVQVMKKKDGSSIIDKHTGVTDLIMDPRDPQVLYAATYQRRRHVFTYVGGGPGSGLYKTVDGGETWQKANKGLPTVDLGRVGLAFAHSNPDILYAIVEAAQGKGGFYKSVNRGASWSKQSSHHTSGNYYTEIYVHPHDENIVYSMNTFNQITRDGGKSFKNLGEEYKHVDNHVIWINPNNPQHILSGCDGGIYESYDHAKTWIFKANLPITQFYKVAVDNDEPFYNIYGGTQDNFSLGGPSQTRNGHGISNDDWFVTQLGDGFESQIDPDNPNIVYAQYQHGGLIRYDRISGEKTDIKPQPRADEDAYIWNWDSPLHTSVHKSGRIYFAANKLFRSDDRGNSWDVISDDLTRNINRNTLKVMGRVQSIDAVRKNLSTSEYGAVVAFTESPLNENLLYAGTDDGLIQITENGGESWTSTANFPGVPDMTYVNMIVASQHDENVVYACFNDHKRGNFKPYVYKSIDKGRTWHSISTNLPKRGSSYSIAEDHVDPQLLFVGTEFSCFFTVDGGSYWKKLSSGLPTIAVRDIAIQRRENDVVLGTFGRSFYVLDDYSALRQIKSAPANGTVFPISDGLVYIEASPLGYTTGKGFQGHSFYTAPNPTMGATFRYFINEKPKTKAEIRRDAEKKLIKAGRDVSYPNYEAFEAEKNEEKPYLLFTITNAQGNVVKKIKTGIKKGLNSISWDGRLPSNSPVSLRTAQRVPWASPDGGNLAPAGTYSLTLTQFSNGQFSELNRPQSFKLNYLDGTIYPASDIAAQQSFIAASSELGRKYQSTTSKVREINNKLKHIRKAIITMNAPSDDLTHSVRSAEQELKSIQKVLYGDNIANTLDIHSPPSLTQRIYAMSYGIWTTTSAPTTTQKEQLNIASQMFANLQPKVVELSKSLIPDIESKLEAAGAPYTPGRSIEWKE